MGVHLLPMTVRVGVQPGRQRLAQTPEPQPHQHHAHQPLPPRGQQGRLPAAAEQQDQAAQESNACGMAQTPEGSQGPAPPASGTQRRQRGQVVRTGEHVHGTGDETRQDESKERHARPSPGSGRSMSAA